MWVFVLVMDGDCLNRWTSVLFSFFPWFGSCKFWEFSWDISFCRCQCLCGLGSWVTSRLSGSNGTFSESGSRVSACWAGVFLLMVAHTSASSAESVSFLVSLTERWGASLNRSIITITWWFNIIKLIQLLALKVVLCQVQKLLPFR